jgi:hypothetical protein
MRKNPRAKEEIRGAPSSCWIKRVHCVRRSASGRQAMLSLVFNGFHARWIASVRCPRLVAALAFPQLNIGRQLAARLIPPEHERRIGSLDRSKWATGMHVMVHVVLVQITVLKFVPDSRRHLDHVVNEFSPLLEPVVAHIVVRVCSPIYLTNCVTLTCLLAVRRHIWTSTRDIVMAPFRPAMSVQKRLAQAIRQHSFKILPTRYVV